MKFVKTALILMILLACNLALSAAIPASERQALIDLYNSTNGASWTDKTNWLGVAGTENTWFGVTTDAGNTTVLQLYLPRNDLVGTLPSSLGNLSNLQYLLLYSNELTGSIPASLGNLSNLQYLWLDSNQLTGSIPSSLGNLSKLTDFDLPSNQLTGSIPAELGNLSKLTDLDLHSNQLTGSIPAELGNLSNLQYLLLYSNELTGSIPASLGNLSNLQYLWLDSNQLTGSIPTSLTNLTTLGSTDIDYNALHTSDAALITFLNSKNPGWATTQTIAPTNVSAVPGSASVSISWTPIIYSGHTGGYRVFYTTVAGGPYVFYVQTANKSASSQLVTGLTPGTPYYFVVQTRTDANTYNQNVVDSENSEEVWATPLIPPTVTVTAPNAGESWTVGSSHNIAWTSTNVANVKIEYSANSGSSYTTIIASTSNSNSYAWTVPNAVSTTCLVRVSDASNAAVNDVSNAVFSIVAANPAIGLSRNALLFSSAGGSLATGAQTVLISNSGTGTLNWSAASPQSWISVSPASGTGTAKLTVSINPSGLAKGTHTGAINVTAAGASNSPQSVAVTLKVYAAGKTSAPIGVFDTPTSGSTVRGSIAVTGWALDDIEVTKVEIRRKPVTGDLPGAKGPDGLIYVGEATFVEGARPDVEAAKPSYPLSYRAGWGYMLLTYGLPAQGNGTFVLHAIASDKDGHTKELGTKTIVSDNAHNTKPFGAIDTPGQGGTVSGTSFVNFGWVLTPPPAMIPVDGSTIMLWIDGIQVGHPTYNQYRADIHDPYPDYLNADGAVGYSYVDTTAYADGMHTISWSATDDHGQGDGIGSRYFWVFNGSSGAGVTVRDAISGMADGQDNMAKANAAGTVKDVLNPVYIRRGFRDDGSHDVVAADALGVRNYEIEEVERVVMALDSPDDLPAEGRDLREKRFSDRFSFEQTAAVRWSGYLAVGDELRPLPIGSTLDARNGVFYWQPGPGFLGTYQFVFVDGRDGKKKFVTLSVRPKSFLQR